jgi:hypothetical protein
MMDAYSYLDPPSRGEATETIFQDVTKEHPTFGADAAHLRIVIDAEFDRFGDLGSMSGWLTFSRSKIGAHVITKMALSTRQTCDKDLHFVVYSQAT